MSTSVGMRTVDPAAMSCAVLLTWACPDFRGSSLGGQLVGLLPINAVYLSLGVLLDVQKYFNISDSHAGLLQTGKEPVLDPGTGLFCYSVVGSVASSRPLVFCRRELGVRLWSWSQLQDVLRETDWGRLLSVPSFQPGCSSAGYSKQRSQKSQCVLFSHRAEKSNRLVDR